MKVKIVKIPKSRNKNINFPDAAAKLNNLEDTLHNIKIAELYLPKVSGKQQEQKEQNWQKN